VPWKSVLNCRAGASNVVRRNPMVNHVRLRQPPSPPPSPLARAVLIHPQQLWPLLTAPQRQALAALLGELLSRRLLPVAAKEPSHEPR
jgi:hypothetical protein